MSEQRDMTEQQASGAACGIGWRGFLSCHSCKVIWLAVLVGLLVVQWPMLKGVVYRASGAVPPEDGIPWRMDFQAALLEAEQTGKPVLLDFTADWCPPCQVMKHDVWPDDAVRHAIEEGYIPVLIDTDRTQNRIISQRYNVRSIPTIIVVDAQGQVIRQGGFMSRSAMVDFLRAARDSG
jgi:thiol:disulfide interchange protein